jgi:predicted anti-sigma-YlaC factor YlaD
MKDKHIIELLDSVPFATFTTEQTADISAHVTSCDSCRDAYEAARVADVLLKERASTVIEPSPFFQTKVLAAWRQRQSESVPVLLRLWRSAGALVSTMAVTTAALAALSFVVPGPSVPAQETLAVNSYSAEGVILDQNASDDQLTDEQVLNAIYAEEDEAK